MNIQLRSNMTKAGGRGVPAIEVSSTVSCGVGWLSNELQGLVQRLLGDRGPMYAVPIHLYDPKQLCPLADSLRKVGEVCYEVSDLSLLEQLFDSHVLEGAVLFSSGSLEGVDERASQLRGVERW